MNVAPSVSKRHAVVQGAPIDLAGMESAAPPGVDKSAAQTQLDENRRVIAERQRLLYADGRHSILAIFQAMDTGGKDGVIRHVFSGVNPQGCRVVSFKRPTAEEQAHSFLWRIHMAVPARGDIGVFNRSHYEDVVSVRVRGLVPESVWSRRFDIINHFERFLSDDGVVILKFFLHIGKDEQRERLLRRLEDPKRNWKFSLEDLEDRRLWDDYMAAYSEAISRCTTDASPWFVVPADAKWYRDLVVSDAIARAIDELDLHWPASTLDLASITLD